MEIHNSTTLNLIDLESNEEAVIIIRPFPEFIALCLSKKTDGDLEILLSYDDCRSLTNLLERVINPKSESFLVKKKDDE